MKKLTKIVAAFSSTYVVRLGASVGFVANAP